MGAIEIGWVLPVRHRGTGVYIGLLPQFAIRYTDSASIEELAVYEIGIPANWGKDYSLQGVDSDPSELGNRLLGFTGCVRKEYPLTLINNV